MISAKRTTGPWIVFLLFLTMGCFVQGFDFGGRAADPTIISGNGIIEATEVEASSKISGRLLEVRPQEGDSVKQGQEIALLEAGELEGQLMAARGNLAATEARLAELEAGTRPEELRRAKAQWSAAWFTLQQVKARRNLVREGPRKELIEQIKANLEQAKVQFADAQTELKRIEILEREGAAPGQQSDAAKTRKDVAEAQVRAARQRLAEAERGARSQELMEAEAGEELAKAHLEAASASLDLALAGPRQETIAAARGLVEQARGQVKTAEVAYSNAKIFSPCDGKITLRNAEPGEIVTPGLPILRIAKLDRVWLRVFVPEPDIERIKIGQKAKVLTDCSKTVYEGKVIEISEKPEFTPKNVQTKSERVKLVFGIKIELTNTDQNLKPGMPADADIHVGN